jgi:nucleotide-binding universal stress UspA family protein
VSAYRTIVVGTDGSESSYLAVEKAGWLSWDEHATLYIACAYHPDERSGSARQRDILRDEAYQVTGSTPTFEVLRTARERAIAAGASQVVERAVVGAPADALLALVKEVGADLLVIGNRGLNTLTGRILGSVPADIARKSGCDVLIVHTVG